MKLLFSKKERKLAKNSIEKLYKFGDRIYGSSLVLIWKKSETQEIIPVKLLVSVPKKNMKKAVDRNYTKRIIRESYRLNKISIYKLILNPVEIIIKYNKSTLPEFNKLSEELLTLMNQIHSNETNT